MYPEFSASELKNPQFRPKLQLLTVPVAKKIELDNTIHGRTFATLESLEPKIDEKSRGGANDVTKRCLLILLLYRQYFLKPISNAEFRREIISWKRLPFQSPMGSFGGDLSRCYES